MNTQQRKENLNKTRKGYTMKNTMTYAVALSTAIDTIKYTNPEVAKRLTALRKTLQRSENSKAKASAKRREATAKARTELCAQVVPILREVITTDMTAKEIFAAAQERLPQDFTSAKVQYILLHEMKDEVEKIEQKGKPNVYKMKG